MTEFDKVIPPGGAGKVTASLDTSHYRGPVAKSVRVTTDDAATRPLVLELKADIQTLIDVKPSEQPYIRTMAGETGSIELTVEANDGRPFDVLAVRSDPVVDVQVRPAPGEKQAPASAKKKRKEKPVASGSTRYLVTITKRPDAPVGQSIGNVTLTTDFPQAETVSIRAIVFVTPVVQAVPNRLVVRPAAEVPVLHVRVTKRIGDPLEIVGVESNDPDFTATASAVTEGREYDVAVRYTGKSGRGAVNSRVTVKTKEPAQRELVIPVLGQL